MGSSKSPTVQTSSNSQTNVAPYASEAQQGLLGYGSSQLGGMLGSNPNYAVAGFNPDQTAAFDLTRGLAQDAFTNTGGTGATQAALASAPNYAALNSSPGLMNFQQQTGLWQAPAAASQATPTLAPEAQGYTPTSMSPTSYSATTYSPTNATAAQLDPSAYKAFLNPYVDDVVNTTTANMRRQYDQTAAGIGAKAAASGAFGGSRQAIQSAQLDRSFGEQVATTTAQLMSAGYDKATASAMANAQMTQQTNLANASAANQAGQFNAGAQNSAGQFNAGAQNAASQFNAGAQNTASQFGASANNSLSQFNAGLMNSQNQFNAGQQNTRDSFNASQGAAQLQNYNANQLQAFQQQQNASVQMAQLQEAIRQGDTSRQVQALQMLAAMGVTQQQLAQSAINVPTTALQQYAKIVPTQVPTTTATQGTVPNTQASPLQQLLGVGATLGAAALK